MIDGPTASSAIRYCESLKEKMERLMIAGDMTDKVPNEAHVKARKIHEEIYRRCLNGEKTKDVCEELGIPIKRFWSYVHKHGWKINRPKKPKRKTGPRGRPSTISEAALEEACRLREQGLIWREIGERLGCQQHTIRHAAARFKEKKLSGEGLTKDKK